MVDALDECADGSELVDLIAWSISSTRSCVKWIVSSRNWRDLEKKLSKEQTRIELRLELNPDLVSHAVDIYVDYKVDELAQESSYDEEIKTEAKSYLKRYANGTFLWVALVCKELAKVEEWDVIDTLKSFPSDLKDFYGRMMTQVCSSISREKCKEILAVVSLVYRPISLDELKTLVSSIESFKKQQLEIIIGLCGSFLTTRADVVYFVHQSAKDFLLENTPNDIFPLKTDRHHYTIFSRSMAALMRILRRDHYNLQQPGTLTDKIQIPDSDPLAPIRYSCVYWIDHLAAAESTHEVSYNNDLVEGGTIDRFIRQKYLYWLECLSLVRSIPEGVRAVLKLKTIIANVNAPGLAELVEDTVRFLHSFKFAIETAPLQAYTSALIFSPQQSLIKQIFQSEQPNRISLRSSIDLDWNACVQTLEGHGGWVNSVIFSPDGQKLASASHDRTIKVWDAVTGVCVQTLEGHGDLVNSVVFSPDGQKLASASDDETVKVWDAITGACVRTLEGHGDLVTSVVFSPDGQKLASASHDITVKVWDAVTGACVQTLEGHGNSVTSVIFSPDGQKLASASDDETVKVWDAITGACVQTLEGHGDLVTSVIFSPDGQKLASASDDETVKVWDAITGACVRTLEGHGNLVNSVVFSPDGQKLASASHDITVKVWDAVTGACVQTLEGHGDLVNSVIFSPDGQKLASASDDKTVKVWDAITGAYVQTLEGHGDLVTSVVFSPDGQKLASASCDMTVKVWDAVTGACVQTLEGHGDWVNSVIFSPDGQKLASASDDKTIKVWDTITGVCIQTLKSYSGPVNPAIFSPNSQKLNSQKLNGYDSTTNLSYSTSQVAELPEYFGRYCLSFNKQWIVHDGHPILWLPTEYRGTLSTFAVAKSTITIGCSSGRVLIIDII